GLGLLLADFQAISRPLLISIDEIDLLDHSQDGGENERHQQLLHFLRQLRGKVALLLVGHRAVIESDVTQTVEPLGADDLMSWFETLSIPAQQGTIARLITLTQGNPLLISMAFALYFWSVEQDPTVTFDDALKQMPQSGALLPIWRRLASRLDGNELALLEALSVFRGAAPADAWMVESNEGELVSLVGRLESRQLIQNDGQGGVYLLPSLRQLINEEQGVEQREQRHLQAALIFSQRGEPTEAAFHFLAGGRADKAIEIWYPHRASEIERGQVEKANAIFESLSARNLKPAWQKRLAIVRSELNQLSGQHDRVIRDLSRQRWQNNQFESIEAYKLWGDALQDQGQPDAAEEILSQGLDVVTHLLQRYSYLHVQRSRLYLQQREMANAKREADLARFHAENMHGAIQDQLGNYDLAILHYETALSLAESLKDFRNVARTQYYMAIAMSRLQRFEESVSCFEKAIEAYKRVGDRVQAEHVRSNLGASYLFAEEYEEAIKYCLDALAFYERSGNTYWVAHNACNLAEAYYALGKYKDAEGYAQLAISQEEIDSLPYALYTLGMVRKVANDLTSAARFLLETGQYAENNEDRFLLAYSLRELGSAYRQLGKVDEGNACIGRSLALFKQLKIEKEVVSTELLLHESQ
ncbi:MAG: tetratricopeptide repeat protein, partial [Chloroflexota bacterium]